LRGWGPWRDQVGFLRRCGSEQCGWWWSTRQPTRRSARRSPRSRRSWGARRRRSGAGCGRPSGVDTQLFLFTFSGRGVVANDDSKQTLRSTLPGTPLTPGQYFLAISSFDVDPMTSVTGLIFPSVPTDGVFGPTGPGGDDGGVTRWQGSGGTGTYTIALDLSPVPEPTTLILWGTTLAGLGLACWKRGVQN
jgi:hypothetical protein